MKIGIIGAGNIGGGLGRGWAKHGHEIMFGARDPDSANTLDAVESIGEGVRVGKLVEAAAFGDVIVIAVPWPGVPDVVRAMGNVSGKIVIDTTNRLRPTSPDDSESAAQDIARLAIGARVVKAFNTVPAEGLSNPIYSGLPVTTFVAGDDAEAKAVVMGLASELGMDAIDAGPLENAAHIEAMIKLWLYLSRNGGLGRNNAMMLVKR